MNILAVDDEKLILDTLAEELEKVFPGEHIKGETSGKKALAYLEELKKANETLSYAFLDIQLRGMTGIELGKSIKELFPDAKIIFCTAYSEYACESYQMKAIGYLLKPVSAEDIIKTLEAMDKDWEALKMQNNSNAEDREIVVKTFGVFEVYVDGKILVYERERAREILAYLIDRRGDNVTVAELAEILFEDKTCDRKTMNQVYAILSSLKKSLKDAGIDDIYVKKWKYISVDMSKLQCDFIELEKGSIVAMNSYKGNYLENYSWGEFTNAQISSNTNSYL